MRRSAGLPNVIRKLLQEDRTIGTGKSSIGRESDKKIFQKP